MRNVWGVAAVSVVSAALSVSVGTASAEPVESAAAQQHFMLFTGADLWRNGGFAHAGVMWAPSGLDNDGLVLKLAVGGGLYRYHSSALGGVEITGTKTDAAVLPGWRFRRGDLYLTVFAGLDWQRHKLLPDDPNAGLRGSYIGLRTAIELWYQPTPITMVAGDAAASTIGPSYSARLAYGWRLFELFYAGPEISGFTSNGNYQQYRAGIHVTGLKFSKFSRTYLEWLKYEWSAGFGLARDSDHRQSLYLRLGLILRQ
jgi:hypothetical protein